MFRLKDFVCIISLKSQNNPVKLVLFITHF